MTQRPRAVKWPAALLVVTALITSCSMAATTPPVSRDLNPGELTTTSQPPPTTATSTTLLASHPPATLPAASDLLISPSGVVVAILEQTATGYRVRTPCGDEAYVVGGSPVGPVQVVIDPGHGGEPDPGAVGSNGITESDLNLRVSRRVEGLLEEQGIATVLTRTADYSTTLTVRAQLADHTLARLMVSVHHNAPTPGPSDVPGTEVFVQHESASSHRLGGLLYEHIVEALDQFDIAWSAEPDAGVLEVLLPRGVDAYGMLRAPETVTALAELGYLSNPAEAELFATEGYVEVSARAVADAIVAYLDTDDPGSGFVAAPRVFTPQRGISSSACEDPGLY